jgi:mono/diheme cytochrome c family protein
MAGPYLVLKQKMSIGAISLLSATMACESASAPTEEVGTCEEDVAHAAELVLEQNCHQCHGQNGTANGSMNFIMDAEQLIEKGFVIPGDPEGSPIYARMAADTMPPVGVSLRPDDAARESVRKWIECGAPSFGETDSSREFVSTDEVLAALRNDLELRVEAANRKYTRYLSLVNLHNDPSVSDDSLITYRHGLTKQVNDVSFGPDLVSPESIDDRGILYRIDIRNYDWQAEANGGDLWELMANNYPYGVHDPDNLDAAYLYQHTTSLMPVMNADWFVFAASEPPLYYSMLRLPLTVAELQQSLGVAQNGKVWTAGVVNSGVSFSNRIVRRRVSEFGAFWESADFASSNEEKKNIQSYPLAPDPASPELAEFEHAPDGGEYIFSLPNGLHGYLITDNFGVVIEEAPQNIVFDRNDPYNGAVRSGRKCSKCHANGINPVVDEVRDYVVNSPDFPEAVKTKVMAEYPTVAEFGEIVASDREAFLAARSAIGIPPSVEGNDSVPISFLADSFQASVDIDRVAADFGLPLEILRAAIESSEILRTSLGPILVDGGDVKREVFRDVFPVAVCVMGLGQPMINGTIVSCAQICGCQNPNSGLQDPTLPLCGLECSGVQVLGVDQCGMINYTVDCPPGLVCKDDPVIGPFCG